MSSFDFKIQYPNIPLPKVSDEMGIAPIEEAIISQSGSSGVGSFDISPPSPLQASDSHQPSRRFTGALTANEPTEAQYKTAIEAVYSTASTKPVVGDLITLNTSTEFNTRLFVYSTDDSAPDIATIQFEIDSKNWYAYNFIGGSGGSAGLSTIQVELADGGEIALSVSAALADYDSALDSYWSIVFAVVNDKITTGGITYDKVADAYEYDVDGYQTKCRLRIITELLDDEGLPFGVPISTYGQYREVTLCKNGEPVQSLIKIS
jgi:hypothetical protein